MSRTRSALAAPISLLTLSTIALSPAGRAARADDETPFRAPVLHITRDSTTNIAYAKDARGPGSGVPSMNKIIPAYTWREKARARGHRLRAGLYNAVHYGEHMGTVGIFGYLLANAASEQGLIGAALGTAVGYLWARAHNSTKKPLENALAAAAAKQGPLMRALQRKDIDQVERIAGLQLEVMRKLHAAVSVPEEYQQEAAYVAQNLWLIHQGPKVEYPGSSIATIQAAKLTAPPMDGVSAAPSHRRGHVAAPPINLRADLDEWRSELEPLLPQRPHLGGFQMPGFLQRGRGHQPDSIAQQPLEQ